MPFWGKDWFTGLAVTLVFASAAGLYPLRSLEGRAYDLGVRYAPQRPANDAVVVVAVDDASLERLGPWPWPRELLAQGNTRLAAGRPAVIAYALPFDEAQNEQALAVLREVQEAAQKGAGRSAGPWLQQAERRLQSDHVLAASFKRAGNVILAASYRPRSVRGSGPLPLPRELAQLGLAEVQALPLPRPAAEWLGLGKPLVAERVRPPLPLVAQAAAATGLVPATPLDGVARAVPLVLAHGEQYLPSLALLATAQALRVRPQRIVVELGRGVHLAKTWLATDLRLQAYPFFYRTHGDKAPFPVISFHELLAQNPAASALRNKVVLVGATASALAEPLSTPIGEPMAPVMLTAHAVASMLNGDLYRSSSLSFAGRVGAFVLVALYLMFILPSLRPRLGLALSALLLAVLVYTEFVLLMVEHIWVPLMVPAAALVLGHLLLRGKQRAQERIEAFQGELAEANRMLGLNFQAQGQLDMAFDRFRKSQVDGSLMELLYSLALDYERKRQFNKAHNVYQYLAAHDRGFRDIEERLERSRALEETAALGLGPVTRTTGSLIVDGEGVQRPMLGRYEIQRELARGGMGVVYLGKDPKLSRILAIKTLALSQEFEGERLQEVKERFFREAKTAARLNHPNIVTIYDVGAEEDFAYIAMDYMEGEPLSAFCDSDNLLPLDELLDVMAQVADALEYAHGQRIVHRDIKPANIIYDREKGIARVTDFGVACLIDSRVTNTGIALGTPSYMSPEQLADNRNIDGRSDLFSLGVSFYELLTGELPFDDESLSALMYKIANKKQQDPRKLRPELPACVSTIVNKALSKELKKRYQTAGEMAQALRDCGDKT